MLQSWGPTWRLALLPREMVVEDDQTHADQAFAKFGSGTNPVQGNWGHRKEKECRSSSKIIKLRQRPVLLRQLRGRILCSRSSRTRWGDEARNTADAIAVASTRLRWTTGWDKGAWFRRRWSLRDPYASLRSQKRKRILQLFQNYKVETTAGTTATATRANSLQSKLRDALGWRS